MGPEPDRPAASAMARPARAGRTSRASQPRPYPPSARHGMAGVVMEREDKPKKPPEPRADERRRGGPAKPVAELVPQIGRAPFRRFGFVQSSVVTRWPEIVGHRHAQVCMPESIRFPPGEKSDGILQLVVLPAHAPLIQHVIPEIIERVN